MATTLRRICQTRRSIATAGLPIPHIRTDEQRVLPPGQRRTPHCKDLSDGLCRLVPQTQSLLQSSLIVRMWRDLISFFKTPSSGLIEYTISVRMAMSQVSSLHQRIIECMRLIPLRSQSEQFGKPMRTQHLPFLGS